MKFENTSVWGFEHALRGMRNPKNSWNKSDSEFKIANMDDYDGYSLIADKWITAIHPELNWPEEFSDEGCKLSDEYINKLLDNSKVNLNSDEDYSEFIMIGPNDMKLAQSLIKAGPEHRKFLRQIFVSVDITAPLFWWK